jgi:hypothetical protein
LIFSTACFSAGRTKERFSLAPLGLPGRLMISEDFLTPATALEMMAWGVISALFARMYSPIPGISRSMTSKVASGVTSLGLTLFRPS